MGGDLAVFDIIFFALVAGFLILRLRSVLGRRTGQENRERWTPRLPTRGAPAPGTSDRPAGPATVTPLPGVRPVAPAAAAGGSALDTAFAQIKSPDPNFYPPRFVARPPPPLHM